MKELLIFSPAALVFFIAGLFFACRESSAALVLITMAMFCTKWGIDILYLQDEIERSLTGHGGFLYYPGPPHNPPGK